MLHCGIQFCFAIALNMLINTFIRDMMYVGAIKTIGEYQSNPQSDILNYPGLDLISCDMTNENGVKNY